MRSRDGGSDLNGATARERTLQQALELAYAHLNRRERTVAEVRAQLQRKGVSQTRVEETIAELIDQRLVDDERFAGLYVADKRQLERWGSERIRRGLARRGIDAELAERALAADDDGATFAGDALPAGGSHELGRALDLLRRRFPHPPRDRRDRERALGMLLRKGYEHELAIDALNAHVRGE